MFVQCLKYFKGTKFRGFRGLGDLPRNLIPAKFSSFKVINSVVQKLGRNKERSNSLHYYRTLDLL